MLRRKNILTGLLLASMLLLAIVAPAFAQGPPPPPTDPVEPLPQAPSSSNWNNTICLDEGVPTIGGLQCLLANVFSLFIPMMGFIIFIMLIVGSFRYLISAGNSKGVETGRKTITAAIIGLVIALSAFIILNLIASFTGVDAIRTFSLPNFEPGQTQPNITTPVPQ